MFVSQAHSFKQQARLAITLAWVGGYTNTITLLTCRTVTSHVSGTSSNFGLEVASGQWGLAAFGLFLLTTFFLGAAISGLCTEFGHRRGWESIYVLPIIVETLLLAAFAVGLELIGSPDLQSGALYWMTGVASMAMGVQNSTITRISSGTVRTTHVTGVLTDLGHEFVQFLWWLIDRRRNVPPANARSLVHSVYHHPTARRLSLLASIFTTFILGAALGTLAYEYAARLAMFPPVAFLGWIIYQDISRPIAEIEPSPKSMKEGEYSLPPSMAVYHLRKDHDRHGAVHRLPNLLAWAKRLPAGARVVILDLGDVNHWDGNAMLELRAVLAQFEIEKRYLIISGVTNRHFQSILEDRSESHFSADHLCSDLELAIARGINLVEEIQPN